MNKNSRIYVAGQTGLLGSALVKRLGQSDYSLSAPPRHNLNLLDSYSVQRFFKTTQPDYVFLAAAKVGNINENIKYPVEFLEENLLIQQNVMRAACESGVKKLLFFASNCCYPRECLQPMREEYLMIGPLEPTNRAYAMAKLAGIEMCRSFNIQYGAKFYSLILASLYGSNDHFGTPRAHVIADMIHKFHQAKKDGVKELTFWGDGSPLREYLYVDDAADAAIFMMDNFNPSTEDNLTGCMFLNAGMGEEISITNLTRLVAGIVGYEGKINWDISKPNGMPRKLLDSSRCYALGWRPKTSLEEGIKKTYHWYLENLTSEPLRLL